MQPVEFLRAVWPAQGIYALATPFTIPGTDTRVYAHKTFTSIDEAAAYADRQKSRVDLYFAVHTLKEPRVWNPAKVDRKTGELGAFEVRTHANMAESQAFFFDLDVAPDRPDKYASQADALQGLKQFCTDTRLPRPLVVSSGGGLHAYWRLTAPVPSAAWRQQAQGLRQLARHYGLKADPARTTDIASVLRVAGTLNHKQPDQPRPVAVLRDGIAVSPEEFETRVHEALTRADLTLLTLPTFVPDTSPFGALESNLVETFDGPPVSFRAVVAACPQMQHLTRLQGNVSEPEWYHSINLARFVENGLKYVHKLSAGHPEYDPAKTDAKIAQLEQKGIKPTSCAKLAEVAGEERCIGCVFAGKVKNPLMAARFKDPAPPPLIPLQYAPAGTPALPQPPAPFTRLKSGGVGMEFSTKDGDTSHVVIYPYDLYPLQRIADRANEKEQQLWHVELPNGESKDFTIDADALYDRRKFSSVLPNLGIYPTAGAVANIQDYMIAYVSQLQKAAAAQQQVGHLGWSADHDRFVLPYGTLLPDGTMEPSRLSLGAQRAAAQVQQSGTLQEQVKLLHFYAKPEYTPHQFFITAGLAAPLFYMTGHYGVIVNASGPAGASKSTSLYTAASFWGRPETYPINGTNNGATMRGRNERVTILANLPVCVDEITHLAPKDAVDLAMGITQPGHRIRLTSEGIERASVDSQKATMMLATANSSLHTLLSTDNAAGTAGSMRVFEVAFPFTRTHTKHQADAYLMALREHYGHIGPTFMQWVVRNRTAVEQRMRATMQRVDTTIGTQPSERFWSAAAAAVIVAGEIAYELGLLMFDMKAIERWVYEDQFPRMRGTVQTEYRDAPTILADYLDRIQGDILITDKMPGPSNLVNIVRHPRGALVAHYELNTQVLWLARTPFREYCTHQTINANWVIQQVDAHGWLVNKHAKRTLGAKTEYSKLQVPCIGINMAHPDIATTFAPPVASGGGTPVIPITRAASAP